MSPMAVTMGVGKTRGVAGWGLLALGTHIFQVFFWTWPCKLNFSELLPLDLLESLESLAIYQIPISEAKSIISGHSKTHIPIAPVQSG